MKKITTVAVFMLLLFQTKAQNVSINYVQQFVAENKSPFTNNKFTPYAVSSFTVAFSQPLKQLPINLNIVASRTRRRPPPHLIKYPDPPVYGKYAIDNKIEADSANLASSRSNSMDLLLGAGYIIPHNENSKWMVVLNADFGISINSDQAVNYYFQKKLTGKAEVKKSQFVINPNVQAKYFFTRNIGLNLTAGYNNQGGANAGVGIVIGKKCNYVGHVTLLK